MDNFFKRCGIGIVVIVTSPFWLAYFALYILYASISLILSPLKILVYALKHRNYTIKSHYDVEAEERLNANNNPQQNNFMSPFSNNNYYPPNQPQVSPTPQQPLNISINLVNPNQNNQDGNNQNNFNQNNYNQPTTQAYIDYSNQNGQLPNNNPPEISNNQNPSNYDINGGNYNG